MHSLQQENNSLKVRLDKVISESNLKENKLTESEEKFHTSLNSIGDAVITTDRKGGVFFMNAVAENLTGWKLKEVQNKPLDTVFKIVNEQSRQKVESPVSKVLVEGVTVNLANHTLLIVKDGKEIPIADSGAPIKNEKGATMGVVLVFRDQTHERRIQRQIQESEEKYRKAFQTSPDTVNINRMDGLYVDINEGFTNLTGYSREEVIGKLSSEIDIWAIPSDRNKLIKGLNFPRVLGSRSN